MYSILLLLLALVAWPVAGSGTSGLQYCASMNTGAGSQMYFDLYMSNGLCRKKCRNDYAFAILLNKKCWCSNIAPAPETETGTSSCGENCPGYPQDACGNQKQGLFAYVALSNAPSGTASVAQSTHTSEPSPTSTPEPTTSTSDPPVTTTTPDSTTESTSPVVPQPVTETVTVTPSSSSSPPDPTSSTSTTHLEPIIQTHTVDGQVTTVTVSVPPATLGATMGGANESHDSGISRGAIAGIVVGTVVGCAAVGAALFFFFARRRKRSETPDASVQGGLIDRNSKGSGMSFAGGAMSVNSNPPQRMPTFTDNRMKTDSVINPDGDRHSRISFQDNEDYSRPVLRLTNPD